jgi:hypothetical protein
VVEKKKKVHSTYFDKRGLRGRKEMEGAIMRILAKEV